MTNEEIVDAVAALRLAMTKNDDAKALQAGLALLTNFLQNVNDIAAAARKQTPNWVTQAEVRIGGDIP